MEKPNENLLKKMIKLTFLFILINKKELKYTFNYIKCMNLLY